MGLHQLKNVILYGAGTQNLRMAYQPIVSAGYGVLAICDQDEEKQGKSFYGVDIISPEVLAELDRKLEDYLLVITIRTKTVVDEVIRSLSQLRHAEIFSFDQFISHARLNSQVMRFSCLMVHLVDDCNLNCVRCSHFSSLADRGGFFLDPKEFEEDCKKLSELTAGDVDEFQLSGGEPMMHPKAGAFPYIVRKYFPKTQIIMITNGTLIPRMDEAFWNSCRDNCLKLMVTRYPISLAYEELEKELVSKGIDVEFGNTGNVVKGRKDEKMMWGLPLKLEGGLDGQYNFDGCLCMQYILRGGRLYPCANSAYIDLFNNYFNLKLPGPEVNGVDFRNVGSLKEVTDAISVPAPLCEYCDARRRMPGIAWRVSDKKLEEWILTETEAEDET